LQQEIVVMPPSPFLHVFPDADALARGAAAHFAASARASIAARGRFTVALAGGSTPEKTYRLLAGGEFAREIDWPRVLFFFGDERFVPRTDAVRSNYGLAARTLLLPIGAAPDRVFPVDTGLPMPGDAARAYEAVLRAEFAGDATPDGIPVFDLVLLGLGDDGHTASLFPHAAALDRKDALAVASPPGALPPPVNRITLTFPVLNAARQALFLIAGENKALALHDILEGGASIADRPAAGVDPPVGKLIYFVDVAAAASLSALNRGVAPQAGEGKEIR
jgi:6-phosphogluconolactonase